MSTPSLSLYDVLLAWTGIASVLCVSQLFQLELGPKLVIASVRTFIQLSLLGLVLQPIIDNGSLALVLVLSTAMVMVAAVEVVNRLTHVYQGILRHVVIAIVVGPVINGIAMICMVVIPDPLYNPQYTIPLLGMLLGNCLTAATLGLGEAMSAIATDGGDNIEFILSRGGTLLEACRPVAAQALSKGLLPTINSMTVIGVVVIPGMMTGQLLGGADPVQAARYQIVIMYYIVASSCFSLLTATCLALNTMTDGEGRLLRRKLTSKKKGKDIAWQGCVMLKEGVKWICSRICDRNNNSNYALAD